MKIFTVGIFFLLPTFFSNLISAANTDMVDSSLSQFESLVKDILWCGRSNEAIIVLTDNGVLYRSRDRGLQWKKLQSFLGQTAQSVLDMGQEVSY